jgi:phosphoribosylformylglycinamidine synthase
VLLFGEGGARALYSVPMAKVPLFKSLWRGFPLLELGRVQGAELEINGVISVPVDTLPSPRRIR